MDIVSGSVLTDVGFAQHELLRKETVGNEIIDAADVALDANLEAGIDMGDHEYLVVEVDVRLNVKRGFERCSAHPTNYKDGVIWRLNPLDNRLELGWRDGRWICFVWLDVRHVQLDRRLVYLNLRLELHVFIPRERDSVDLNHIIYCQRSFINTVKLRRRTSIVTSKPGWSVVSAIWRVAEGVVLQMRDVGGQQRESH